MPELRFDESAWEEYLEAQDAYEAAVLLQEERAMENYYENKYR